MNVPPGQIASTVVLVIVLLGMAVFWAYRQWRTLQRLHGDEGVSAEDRQYSRRQAWRRLVCSGLMVVLAVMLAAHLTLEEPAQKLVEQGEINRMHGERPPPDAEQQRFIDLYRTYWIIFLLVLLAIIGLTAADILAIRRFGLSQYRKLQADRRTMIENQLARLRSQRNGHN
jgi:hypothetical protein